MHALEFLKCRLWIKMIILADIFRKILALEVKSIRQFLIQASQWIVYQGDDVLEMSHRNVGILG